MDRPRAGSEYGSLPCQMCWRCRLMVISGESDSKRKRHMPQRTASVSHSRPRREKAKASTARGDALKTSVRPPPHSLARQASPPYARQPSRPQSRPNSPPLQRLAGAGPSSEQNVEHVAEGGKSTRDLRKQGRHVAKLMDRSLLDRYRLENEQTRIDSSQKLMFESLGALLQALKLIFEDASHQPLLQHLNTLHNQVCKHHDALGTQQESTKPLRDDLKALDFRLKKQMEGFTDALSASALHARPIRDEGQEEALAVTETSVADTGDSRSTTPSLIDRYFTSKGDVQIYTERLDALDYEHQEQLETREFISERGDPVEPSDEDFHNNFLAKRQPILDKIERASLKANLLAEACKAAGFTIIPTPRGSSSRPDSGDLSVVSNALSPLPELPRPEQAPRVRGWLHNVRPEDIPLSIAIETSRASSPVRHVEMEDTNEGYTTYIAVGEATAEKQQSALELQAQSSLGDARPARIPLSRSMSDSIVSHSHLSGPELFGPRDYALVPHYKYWSSSVTQPSLVLPKSWRDWYKEQIA